MTKEQMLETIDRYQIKNYYVSEDENGDFTLRFGDDDPLKEIEKLKMDNTVIKTQVKYLMSIMFKIPYDKTEELIK